jgi:gamma-tubulin complex component 3
LFGGELHDPFSEFFVAINPEMSSVPHTKPQGLLDLPGSDEYGEEDMDEIIRPDADGGRRLWQDQYMFRKEMLPSFVDETFGKKVRLPSALPKLPKIFSRYSLRGKV